MRLEYIFLVVLMMNFIQVKSKTFLVQTKDGGTIGENRYQQS